MKIQDQIKKLQKQILVESNLYEKKKAKLRKEIDDLYEKFSALKIGDRVKVASVNVRDIHRNSDLEILGKQGNVTKIEHGWIVVKLDGHLIGHMFLLDSDSLEKVK